ncbi:dTDP-4-dehydrorhamnose 3,5-epimerase family protein [Candidatus Microgenomates bacterium]|nr:dTDP-4-dehydrorhamnose 3,5-epimerase family protein [Candidatus Microgenomates bacterium]
MNFKLIKKPKHTDHRGSLVEFLSQKELKKAQFFGEIHFAAFNRSGVIRGNHYHTKKEEYFGVVIGKVQIEIEDIKTKEHQSFILDTDDPEFICLQIGPNIAHAAKSLSDSAVLINYSSLVYNPKNPDSFKYILLKESE